MVHSNIGMHGQLVDGTPIEGVVQLREALTADPGSDADWLRNAQASEQYLPEVVRQQCLRFEGG